MNHLPFPKSFPNAAEEKFLDLVLCNDNDFHTKWNAWKQSTLFEETNHATAKLFPLIYLRMQKLALQDDELFGRIKGIYRNAWVKNQRLLAVTKEVVSKCNEKNIALLILKGVPLLLEVYKDTGARFLGDADFIIPPQHAPAVVKMMLADNWQYDKTWTPESNNPVSSMYRVIKSTGFVNAQGIKLDIHWNIFALNHHAKTFDVFSLKNISSIAFRDAFWHDAVSSHIDDIPCKRLCNEDLLIHVIIHGTEGNTYRPLRWVVDGISIINKFPINWDFIQKRAKDFGFHVELSIGFRYLKEKFNANIPEPFLREISQIPVTKKEIKKYYRFSNISHSDRYSAFGNFPLIWYAYWKFEPKPRTVFGFLKYLRNSFGLKSNRDLFEFIIKKYKARLFPGR